MSVYLFSGCDLYVNSVEVLDCYGQIVMYIEMQVCDMMLQSKSIFIPHQCTPFYVTRAHCDQCMKYLSDTQVHL